MRIGSNTAEILTVKGSKYLLMVNIDCQLDRVQNHLEDRPLDQKRIVLLKFVEVGRPTFKVANIIPRVLYCIKKGKPSHTWAFLPLAHLQETKCGQEPKFLLL